MVITYSKHVFSLAWAITVQLSKTESLTQPTGQWYVL